MKFIDLNPASAFDQAVKSCNKDKKLIVCGSDEDQRYIEEALFEPGPDSKAILRAAAQVDAKAWLQQRRAELEAKPEWNPAALEGQWQEESQHKQGFNLATDFVTGEPLHTLLGVRIKTDQSWKVPAHFRFGGWNECPAPEVHCAIWKRWQKLYGAHIVGVSNDVIEAHVKQPPATQEEALKLAWEQYLYCPDIVEQGVESVAKLAEVLINHDCWYFWWD
ncbi:DUF4253 domain-containing protein [Neptuniibacter halophilus]|uniref:DUF4253 domain-containing protein n=1 Tax=Neptuniibacter halophilus TaxID=651666 RepID=UPI002574258D|nr:DUF4253 domain-containing protein [Neptuniibacter halophilus]